MEKKPDAANSTIINIPCQTYEDTSERMQQQPQYTKIHDREDQTMCNAENNKNKTMYSGHIQYQPAWNQSPSQHLQVSSAAFLDIPVLVWN